MGAKHERDVACIMHTHTHIGRERERRSGKKVCFGFGWEKICVDVVVGCLFFFSFHQGEGGGSRKGGG